MEDGYKRLLDDERWVAAQPGERPDAFPRVELER